MWSAIWSLMWRLYLLLNGILKPEKEGGNVDGDGQRLPADIKCHASVKPHSKFTNASARFSCYSITRVVAESKTMSKILSVRLEWHWHLLD